MKCFFLTQFLLLLTNLLFAQNTQFSNDSDTTFWYHYKNEYAKQFKLGFIENELTDYSFRFWSSGLVVKISNSGDQNFGEVIRFVESYPNNKNKKVFTRHYAMSSSQINKVRQLIDSLQIRDLPSDKNIKGWNQGFDGVMYFTECKKNGHYSFKNYWTPDSQGLLEEAMQFSVFVTELYKIINFKYISMHFENAIPFNSWSNPGSRTIISKIKE